MFITINNQRWEIKEVNPNNRHLFRSDNISVLGVTDNAEKTVYISNRLNKFMRTKVLTHEICHVFCFSYGIYLPLDVEETVADFVASYGRDIIEITDEIIRLIIWGNIA